MDHLVVDANTTRIIMQLQQRKDEAVADGGYSEARTLKLTIERLKVLGHSIYTTESARNAALQRQQYDLAKLLAQDASRLHAAREQMVASHGDVVAKPHALQGIPEPVVTSEEVEPVSHGRIQHDVQDSPPRKRGRLRKGTAPRRADMEGYVRFGGAALEVKSGSAEENVTTTSCVTNGHATPNGHVPISSQVATNGQGGEGNGPVVQPPRKRGRPPGRIQRPPSLENVTRPGTEAVEDVVEPVAPRRGRPPKNKKLRSMRPPKVPSKSDISGRDAEATGSEGEGEGEDAEAGLTQSRRSRNPFRISQSHLEMCPMDRTGIRWVGALLTSSPSTFLPQLASLSPEQQSLVVAEAQRLYADRQQHNWEYNPNSDSAVYEVLMPEVRAQNNLPPWKWPQMGIVGDGMALLPPQGERERPPPQDKKRTNGGPAPQWLHDNYVLRFVVDMAGRRNSSQDQVFQAFAPMQLLEGNGGKHLRVKLWLPVVTDSLDTRITRNFTYMTVTRRVHSRRSWEATFWAQAEQYIQMALQRLHPELQEQHAVPAGVRDNSQAAGNGKMLLLLAGAVEEAEAQPTTQTYESLEMELSTLHYASAYMMNPDRPLPPPPLLHPTSHSLPYYPPVIPATASTPFASPLTSPSSSILYVAPADIHPKRAPPIPAAVLSAPIPSAHGTQETLVTSSTAHRHTTTPQGRSSMASPTKSVRLLPLDTAQKKLPTSSSASPLSMPPAAAACAATPNVGPPQRNAGSGSCNGVPASGPDPHADVKLSQNNPRSAFRKRVPTCGPDSHPDVKPPKFFPNSASHEHVPTSSPDLHLGGRLPKRSPTSAFHAFAVGVKAHPDTNAPKYHPGVGCSNDAPTVSHDDRKETLPDSNRFSDPDNKSRMMTKTSCSHEYDQSPVDGAGGSIQHHHPYGNRAQHHEDDDDEEEEEEVDEEEETEDDTGDVKTEEDNMEDVETEDDVDYGVDGRDETGNACGMDVDGAGAGVVETMKPMEGERQLSKKTDTSRIQRVSDVAQRRGVVMNRSIDKDIWEVEALAPRDSYSLRQRGGEFADRRRDDAGANDDYLSSDEKEKIQMGPGQSLAHVQRVRVADAGCYGGDNLAEGGRVNNHNSEYHKNEDRTGRERMHQSVSGRASVHGSERESSLSLPSEHGLVSKRKDVADINRTTSTERERERESKPSTAGVRERACEKRAFGPSTTTHGSSGSGGAFQQQQVPHASGLKATSVSVQEPPLLQLPMHPATGGSPPMEPPVALPVDGDARLLCV